MLLYEMLAGKSPFDIGDRHDMPDQSTEDYLFQGIYMYIGEGRGGREGGTHHTSPLCTCGLLPNDVCGCVQ